ncbi:MAG TPA: alginate lyase family protein, partial [Gemmataceae bacterium]|nr:alginate lyase family protein [Gemmataceae bacterium]
MVRRLWSMVNKIKGRSPDELRVRLGQALAAYGERSGWSSQAHLPSDGAFFRLLDRAQLSGGVLSPEALLAHFRGRSTPSFFVAFEDPKKTVAALRQRFGPQAEQHVLERARRICAGRFDLLGLHELQFGDPIDWQLEPVAGKRGPRVHWSRINYLDAAQVGDNKIVWELNRHQHFLTLGRAYWYTGDERFAETFAAHLTGWMEQNLPKLGINWASSLEIAFRAISWLWSFYFFRESPHLTPHLWMTVLKFLYLHARHLETYLSTYFSPNTHLTGEALGLYYLGTLLPEFRRARGWRATGREILLRELQRRHIRADGVYFEQSSYYHRYTLDFCAHFHTLAQRNGEPAELGFLEKYAALLDHLMVLTRPDGRTPLFGDDDGGRFLPLDDRDVNDFRAALATGAVLFARPDYKAVAEAPAEETLWLLGEEGQQTFDRLDAQPPQSTSRDFPEGGYYVMRDGWERTSHYLLVDCGPHGFFNCGHAHADVLSFELAAHGRSLLVDPGTYTYTGSASARDWFRSSAAHNVLTIDGESSSAPGGTFSWKAVARAQAVSWRNHNRFDFFS